MKPIVAIALVIGFCITTTAFAQEPDAATAEPQTVAAPAEAAPTEAPAAEATQRSLSFQGVTYNLAWTDVSGQTVTNEYLQEGETREEWTRMIGVRHFRSAHTMQDVLPKYVETVKPLYVRDAEIFQEDENGNDVILALWLSQGGDYIEYNLHRFVLTPDGVMAYQFAQRFPMWSEWDEVADEVNARRNARMLELADAAYPVYSK